MVLASLTLVITNVSYQGFWNLPFIAYSIQQILCFSVKKEHRSISRSMYTRLLMYKYYPQWR